MKLKISDKSPYITICKCDYCGVVFKRQTFKCKNKDKHFCNTKCVGKYYSKIEPIIQKNRFKKGITPWNKGLTKETDKRVKKNIDNRLGYKHSKITKEKLSKRFKNKSWKELYGENKANLMRKNQSDGEKLKERTDKWRKNQRISIIKYIEKQQFNGYSMIPRIGNYEISALDNLEKCFGYTILRQHKVSGYFLDGYCPALNLAIEIDEPYHKTKERLEKDGYRETQIKQNLNCNFLRISVK